MNFLKSFSVRPNPTPILQHYEGDVLSLSDDEMSKSDSESSVQYDGEVDLVVGASSGARSSDIQLRRAATCTPISDIDWNCHHPCKKKICSHRHGFLPFVVNLRNRFWGPTGSAAPTSKQRRVKIAQELSQIHKGGDTFVFGYAVTIDGQGKFINICESAFFKALGTGKTTQWYKAMNILKGGEIAQLKGRAKFKSEKVIAFITLFLAKCEMPPTHGMQHIKILPFPNISHFYQEYCSTFKAPYLAILSAEQATKQVLWHLTPCIDSLPLALSLSCLLAPPLSYTHIYIYMSINLFLINMCTFSVFSSLCICAVEEAVPRRAPLGGGPFNALFPCKQTLCGGTVPLRLTPNTTR